MTINSVIPLKWLFTGALHLKVVLIVTNMGRVFDRRPVSVSLTRNTAKETSEQHRDTTIETDGNDESGKDIADTGDGNSYDRLKRRMCEKS